MSKRHDALNQQLLMERFMPLHSGYARTWRNLTVTQLRDRLGDDDLVCRRRRVDLLTDLNQLEQVTHALGSIG